MFMITQQQLDELRKQARQMFFGVDMERALDRMSAVLDAVEKRRECGLDRMSAVLDAVEKHHVGDDADHADPASQALGALAVLDAGADFGWRPGRDLG